MPIVYADIYRHSKIKNKLDTVHAIENGIVAGGFALSLFRATHGRNFVGKSDKPNSRIQESGDIDIWVTPMTLAQLEFHKSSNALYAGKYVVKKTPKLPTVNKIIHFVSWTPYLLTSLPSKDVELTHFNILSKFDLTICMVSFDSGKFCIDKRALVDLNRGTFRTIKKNIWNPALREHRVKKYEDRGYKYMGDLMALDCILGMFA